MPDHRRIVQSLDVLAAIAADDGNLEWAGLIRAPWTPRPCGTPLLRGLSRICRPVWRPVPGLHELARREDVSPSMTQSPKRWRRGD